MPVWTQLQCKRKAYQGKKQATKKPKHKTPFLSFDEIPFIKSVNKIKQVKKKTTPNKTPNPQQKNLTEK